MDTEDSNVAFYGRRYSSGAIMETGTGIHSMRIDAVTCFNLKGFYETGRLLINGFIEHWPQETGLTVYVDDPIPKKDLIRNERVRYKILDQADLLEFKKRHALNNEANGLGSKAIGGGKNYRYDAVRFSHKVFALIQFLQASETDYLIWLDGDSRTHSPVQISNILSWCPEGKFAGYLARPWLYTETGFHIFNMNHTIADQFFTRWKQYYLDDSIFGLDMWTDCHTYDAAKTFFDDQYWHNLSPAIQNNHPFINGPLGEFMDHMKGPRKKKGTSNRKDLVAKKDHPYWNRVK
jgi:hypothetical protein